MASRHLIHLSPEEHLKIEELLESPLPGGEGERQRKRDHLNILLELDQANGGPSGTNEEIAGKYGITVRTVTNIASRYLKGGIEQVIRDRGKKRPTAQTWLERVKDSDATTTALHADAINHGIHASRESVRMWLQQVRQSDRGK